MNKLKGSFLVKALVHIVLFLLGLTILIGGYNIITYLDSYSANTTTFTESSEFQSKYLKYVERVAVYIDFREKGYSGSIGYDPSIDLSALFEKEEATPDPSNTKSQQEDFDYYNAILNNTNSNFLYFVKNIQTGTIYCSPSLEGKIADLSETDDPDEVMDAYIKSVRSNTAYLILNTETERYVTNVNKNYTYLNDENLNWVMDYITGKAIQNDAASKSVESDYIICTSIAKGFPNRSDEFGTMYEQFQVLHNNFMISLYPVPIAFVFLLLFFVLAVTLTGHQKNTVGITINLFDRLYTEVGFGLVVIGILALGTLGITFSKILFYDFHLKMDFVLVYAYIMMYPFCMFGLLSFIRRCKANVILYNSLLFIGIGKLFSFIKEFFAQRSLTYRVAVILITSCCIQLIALFTYMNPVFGSGFREFIIITLLDYSFLGYVLFKVAIDYNILREETKKLTEGNLTHKIPIGDMCVPARTLGEYINNIGDGFSAAVDEKLKSERLKTELITNVSHDIKTPLTSIINYIDLLKKENLNNQTAAGYIDVLSVKSWRLKTLIEDLVEASKASSGNISMNLERLNLVELIRQSIGEFEDRFVSHNIEAVLNIAEEPIYIMADGRSTYRIIENIFSNVNKYALGGTRVYVNIELLEDTVTVSVKNISANKLNINSDELLERFVRGDLSRNTEGSGLGLSIAKSLATLQDAVFDVVLDGDLFKAMVTFHRIEQSPKIIIKTEDNNDTL